jgi:hypothetical protein
MFGDSGAIRHDRGQPSLAPPDRLQAPDLRRRD